MLEPLKIGWYILGLALIFSACDLEPSNSFAPISVEYPTAIRDTSHEDAYFGLRVKDPYHWMENPASDSSRQWIQSQRSLTNDYLSQISLKPGITNRLRQLWEYVQASSPFMLGDSLAQFIQSEYGRQPVLYRLREDNAPGRLLFDPNRMPEYSDVVFTNWAFARSGRYGAVVVKEAGGQMQSIIVVDFRSGKVLNDEVLGVKDCRIAWYRNGFFYSKYEDLENSGAGLDADYFHQVYYHELGTSTAEDDLVFADRSQPMQVVVPMVTEGESHLLLKINGTEIGNQILIKSLGSRNAAFEYLVEGNGADYDYVGKQGNYLLLLTNDQASNKELVRIRLGRSANNQREVVIPEAESVLQSVLLEEDYLIAVYYNEGSSMIRVFDERGNNPKEVKLPQPGSVSELRADAKNGKAYFSFSSFLSAPTIYELDLESGGLNTFMSSYTAFNTNDYQVRKVRFRSFDGEGIPMYLLHKRGLELTANTPALLLGNGSKYYALGPKYNLTGLQLVPFFLESNGVVAIPFIRGTPDMGKFWYELGIQDQRQKAFDDYQAAATYLLEQGYTSIEKLAAYGQGPVGGLLVAGCWVQRPDLFGTVVGREGIYDLLKYHQFTTAWKYADELGITEQQEDFDPLWAIDPRRNAISTEYPPALLVASTSNVEIAPLHTYKLTAEMQARQQAGKPIIMRLNNNFMDRTMRPNTASIEEGGDILSFIFYQLKHDPFAEMAPVQ
jgi:prolyl oligopeptidase